MAEFIELMFNDLTLESEHYLTLRLDLEKTLAEKDKVARRVELLRQLLAVDDHFKDPI